jgi:8-oxo-dGTP pyrophosphatase MutT (NUDIX family)
MDTESRGKLPIVERTAARLVVIDAADRILLLHVQDLSNPQFGTAWELPGGGMEADETFVDAATRELREETGLEVRPECIEAPRWRRQIEYVYRGVCRHQRELVALVRISESSPVTHDSLRVGAEKEDVIEARWWSIEQIMAGSERWYPRSLPTLLPRFLAGESLEEPLEIWSPNG